MAAAPAGSVPLGPGAEARAGAYGAGLAALPIEEAVSSLGLLYSRSLPAGHRRQHGIFYTPPALAARLADKATEAGMDWARGRVISPACGGGQILLEDARRMVAALEGMRPGAGVADIGARLRGWDTDAFGCWLSQLCVEAFLLPQVLASGVRLPAIARCRDSLSAGLEGHHGRYALVTENPPFGRAIMSPGLSAQFGRSQVGHSNLYGLFADLSLRLAAADGGVISLLTPTSFVSGAYFAKLRRLFRADAAIAGIDFVASRAGVFPDVLQEVALSAFVRGRPQGRAACGAIAMSRGAVLEEPAGDLVLPSDPEAPWIAARSAQGAATARAMASMPARLADWGYRVATGPLVPHKSARMRPEAFPGTVPVVWAECVRPSGELELSHLRAGRLPRYEPTAAGDANLVDQACLLLQRTTVKEQRRRLVGAVLTADALGAAGGKVAVENHLNMVMPSVAKPAVPMSAVRAFFASEAADRAFRCLGGSAAVSASELRAMPVPSAADVLAAFAGAEPEQGLLKLYSAAAMSANRPLQDRQALT